MTLRATLIVLSLALLPPTLRAEDWPRFRGPTGQGISTETNLPAHWSPSDNIAWKTPIPGQGWSSPIIFADRIFLTTATDRGTSCHVLCLDRKTGNILWDKQVLQQTLKRIETKNSYATPTPVTDGQFVYAAFNDGSIAALDFAGSVVWTNRTIKHYSQHGLGASPILYNDLLIMPYDGSSEGADKSVGWQKPWDQALILALDKKTGQTRWQARRGLSRIAHVTPNIMQVNGKPQLISAAGDVVQGHDPSTGQLLWTLYGQGEGVVPSVVLGDNLVYYCTGFGKPMIRAVRPDGAGDVTKTHVAWEQTANVPTMSSPLLANNLLFTIKETGLAMCLDPKTGKILWQHRIPGNYSASPLFADNKIFFLSEEGDTTIIDATPQFKLLAKNSLNEKCQASLAVSNHQLFIRTDQSLFCIGQ